MRRFNRTLACLLFAEAAVLWLEFTPLALRDWTLVIPPLVGTLAAMAVAGVYRLIYVRRRA